MIGIRNIGTYIPPERISNMEKQRHQGITQDFLNNKLGILAVSRKAENERSSDMCVKAFENLAARESKFDINRVDFICVCTQNGDYSLPQTSAIVHSKLNLSSICASFDISLGCSGYVYSILTAKSFMEANNLSMGLVFTSDPYSEIIDPDDKDTDLIFGDGATVTLLTADPILEVGKGAFFSESNSYENLIKRSDNSLYMNGRGIFNFVMRHVPANIKRCLEINKLNLNEVNLLLLHQASKFVIDNLIQRMKLEPTKVPFVIHEYGNTISSTIPIMLQSQLDDKEKQIILISGFGVGLSIASTILRRKI